MALYVHCDQYWKEMDLMIANFNKGIFPIDQGCTHKIPCPECERLNNIIYKNKENLADI